MVVDGIDCTNKIKAGALLMKGFSYGYLSIIYDKGFIADNNDEIQVDFSDYKVLLLEAIDNLDKAIIAANDDPDFTFGVHKNYSIGLDQFKKVTNSYVARFMLANARTDLKRQELDFAAIKSRALSGITEDWAPPVEVDVLFNNYQDWSTYILSRGQGYFP